MGKHKTTHDIRELASVVYVGLIRLCIIPKSKILLIQLKKPQISSIAV